MDSMEPISGRTFYNSRNVLALFFAFSEMAKAKSKVKQVL